MLKVNDIPEQVIRDIAGAYHRRLESTGTEAQDEKERDFQRACYLRTALEWLALWLNQQAAPAAHAAVKQSLTTDERTAAEETYTRRAFDYEQNPIGSRDWTLFWSGWCARAVQSLATIPNSHQPAAQVAQPVADDVVRDAERYRFLRDKVLQHGDPMFPRYQFPSFAGAPSHGLQQFRKHVDDAVDAAIRAAKQQKEAADMSDFKRLMHADTEVQRRRAECEAADAKLEIARMLRNIAFLLSQHEPVATLGLDREALSRALAFVQHGDVERCLRNFDIQRQRGEP